MGSAKACAATRRAHGRFGEAQLLTLAAHLTERDRQIALDCYEHRVLTTQQLCRLHFTDPRLARRRLQTLHRLRVLDRFRPLRPRGHGSAPHHWVLDEAGAHIVAAEQEIPREQLHFNRTGALGVIDSAKLAHHVEANELFTQLAVEATRAGGALAEWYGERTLHRLFQGKLSPDSYGVLRLPDRALIHLLLELDRGTEPSARLREKAIRYTRAIPRSALRETPPVILLAVPSPARARTATSAVADTAAPITVLVWSQADPQPILPTILAAIR